MHALVVLLLLFIILHIPSWWSWRILKQNQVQREDIQGTGELFARHLVKQLHLDSVSIEPTRQGDHYDPSNKAVRLSIDNYDGKSLTAMVVAAHEVGHALQDHLGYRPLHLRTKLAYIAHHAERAGSLIIYGAPIIFALTQMPSSGLIVLILGILTIGISSVLHLVTLPVEFDASFSRALPILKAGNYLSPDDLKTAKSILFACALTYVASSLASVLSVWRWITIFRR